MKPISQHFTNAQLYALKCISEETGLPVAELVRRAVDDYLGRRQRPLDWKTKWGTQTQTEGKETS
jgi:hypothetical protein